MMMISQSCTPQASLIRTLPHCVGAGLPPASPRSTAFIASQTRILNCSGLLFQGAFAWPDSRVKLPLKRQPWQSKRRHWRLYRVATLRAFAYPADTLPISPRRSQVAPVEWWRRRESNPRPECLTAPCCLQRFAGFHFCFTNTKPFQPNRITLLERVENPALAAQSCVISGFVLALRIAGGTRLALRLVYVGGRLAVAGLDGTRRHPSFFERTLRPSTSVPVAHRHCASPTLQTIHPAWRDCNRPRAFICAVTIPATQGALFHFVCSIAFLPTRAPTPSISTPKK